VRVAVCFSLFCIALLVCAGSYGADDWSARPTWDSADPNVRSTAAFGAKYGRQPSRSAGFKAAGGGAVTMEARRGYGGVFEVAKQYPIARTAVAQMARAAVRATPVGVLGAVMVEALSQDGIGWDAGLGDWAYPSESFYWADWPEYQTPSQDRYRVGSTTACVSLRGHAITAGAVQSAFRSCSASYPNGTCSIRTSYGYYPSGQPKRIQCSGGTQFPVAFDVWCVAPAVLLPDGVTCGDKPPPISGPPIPATDTDMEQAFDDWAAANPSRAPELAEDAAKSVPIPGPPVAWTGPDSVPGESGTSTTTGPEGTTTTTKETVHDLDYGNPGVDDITVTDRETTTTHHPDGSTSTTTSTTTGTSTATGDNGGSPPPPPPDVCKVNPKASGCAELGEMEDTTWETHDVSVDLTITPTTGQCPASIPLDILGTTHQLSWRPVCDFAEGIAPIIRAMGALSAGLWVLSMLRKV